MFLYRITVKTSPETQIHTTHIQDSLDNDKIKTLEKFHHKTFYCKTWIERSEQTKKKKKRQKNEYLEMEIFKWSILLFAQNYE